MLAGALSVVLFVTGPQLAAVAESPSPVPTPAATTQPTAATGMPTATPQDTAVPTERPTSAVAPSPAATTTIAARAVQAHPRVSTKGVAKPIRRLVADLRTGDLSEEEAADLAVEMVGGSADVPRRYRLGQVTEYDLMVLGVATGASATTAPGSSRRSPLSTGFCEEMTVIGYDSYHQCVFTGTHTVISYVHERTPGAGADPDVVPDFVQRWAEVSDAAWEYYSSGLGMSPTSDTISVLLQQDAAGNVCGSWPTAQILCGPGVGSTSVEYLAAHEMFHQFQWNSVERAILSFNELDPWMESTADWASAHFTTTMPRRTDSWNGEAARIKWFFDDAKGGLVSRGQPSGNTISAERAYGAVAAVEYLTQQSSESLVKESFDAINSGTGDGLTPINDALAVHYTSLDDISDGLWSAMYTMCDGAAPWSPFGWCGSGDFGVIPDGPGTSETRRPTHDTVWLGSEPAGTKTFSLRRYGAAFTDFVLGNVPEDAYGTTLVLEFDAGQVSADDSVNLVAWKDTPGGDQCETRKMAYPAATGKTAIAVQIPTGCGYATLVAVNKHTGTGTDAAQFPVSWSTYSTGAVIGNGTVTLGVNADGNLGLGESRGMACRSAQAVASRETSDALDQGPALVLDATSYDAIRGPVGWCGSAQPTEGWSVINPNITVDGHPATWSKHGLDYPDEYPVQVISFTSTDTEATSVVRLGTQYTLTQHWHPSTVDARIYQLDVTIRSTKLFPLPSDPQPLPLTYRQVVPLTVDSWNGDHVDLVTGSGDGVTDATNNLYWPWDPDYEPGSIDDPLVPLPAPSSEESNGLAIDITVDGLPITAPPDTPQFSMFYGFADTTTEAASLLNSAGTTTNAIAQTTDWDDNPIALLVGLHDEP